MNLTPDDNRLTLASSMISPQQLQNHSMEEELPDFKSPVQVYQFLIKAK
jgi:hypothetical protein